MSGSHTSHSDVGPSENEKALASMVSGAIIFIGNIIYSIFLSVFRLLASIA